MSWMQSLYDHFGADIREAAAAHSLDEAILAGLIQRESAGNPAAHSSVGATGLTQIMPATAKDRGYDLSTPRGQIFGGADYLAWLRDYFAHGNVEDMLGGYNAGPGRIHGGAWRHIKESAEYVPHVLAFAEQYREFLNGLEPKGA